MNGKTSIQLDLVRRQIRFVFNDQHQGIAYENIKKNKDVNYRLVVAMGEPHFNPFIEIKNLHKR